MKLDYIDTLKGIAIFLVVLGHVLSWCYPNFVENLPDFSDNQIILWKFIYSFHMPLFMFVSGVVALNPHKQYSLSNIGKRLVSYLVPFVVVGCVADIYQRGYDRSLWDIIGNLWYLRTLAIFVAILFFYVNVFSKATLLLKHINPNYLYVLVAIFFYVTFRLFLRWIPEQSVIYKLLDFERGHIGLFTFFIAGYLYRRFESVTKYLVNNYMQAITIGGIILYLIHPYAYYGILSPHYNCFSYVVILFLVNLSHQISTPKYELVGSIGKKTMEIYVLHGLFSTCFPAIGSLFKEVSAYGVCASMNIQLFIAVPISCLVVYTCLIVASIIKENKLLSFLCFGK